MRFLSESFGVFKLGSLPAAHCLAADGSETGLSLSRSPPGGPAHLRVPPEPEPFAFVCVRVTGPCAIYVRVRAQACVRAACVRASEVCVRARALGRALKFGIIVRSLTRCGLR